MLPLRQQGTAPCANAGEGGRHGRTQEARSRISRSLCPRRAHPLLVQPLLPGIVGRGRDLGGPGRVHGNRHHRCGGVHLCKHKRGLPSDASSLAQVCAYAAFYAAAVLAILFFWNWFDELAREGDQSQTRNNYWVVINTLYIVLMGTVSCHLWRK